MVKVDNKIFIKNANTSVDVQDPPIKSMRKGIFLAYSLIGATYFMLAIAGYWAFVSPPAVSPPKA